MGVGDGTCEAYTGSAAGEAIEPRNRTRGSGRSLFCGTPCPRPSSTQTHGQSKGVGPTGVEEPAREQWGCLGTWETSKSPSYRTARGEPDPNLLIYARQPTRIPCVANLRVSDGTAARGKTEARREGHRGVGVLRSTHEAGEPTRGTPWRKGGTGMTDLMEGTTWAHGGPILSHRNCSG